AQSGSPRAIAAVLLELDSKEASHRSIAIRGLQDHVWESAVADAFAQLLSDPDPDIAAAAAAGLGSIADQRALPTLRALASKQVAAKSYLGAFWPAARMLVEMDDTSAKEIVPGLVRDAQEGSYYQI